MRDLNFFSSFEETKVKSSNIMVVTFGIAFIVLAGIYAATESSIMLLDKSNTYLESQINNADKVKKLSEVNDRKKRIEILQNYEASLNVLNTQVDKASIVGTDLLNRISGCRPDGLTFKMMTLTQIDLNIQGDSASRPAIADLIAKVKELGLFKDIFVGSITMDESTGAFKFTMKCLLKDVN